MRVLSWNVGLAPDLFRKVMCIKETRRDSITRICNRILIEDVEIVALQEVYERDFEEIKKKLKINYPYSVNDIDLGLCFFSKVKISKEYKIKFPKDILSRCLCSNNGILVVREKKTRRFFCNVHMSCGLGCKYEMDYLNVIKKVHGHDDLFVLGDFNLIRHINFKTLCKKMNINENKYNNENSYRHPLFKCNLDYIIYFTPSMKEGIEMPVEYIEDDSSDHIPIITDIS
tara:strand:+ start:104 stop:790 length:687 start_codon:yes stop_codon:yes gene_type:complete